jgi:hypothetical protein
VAPVTLIRPAAVSLGDVLVGQTHRQPAAVTVESQDPGLVTIQRVWFEDVQGVEDTSGDWVIESLDPAAAPPFALGPGHTFGVDIAVRGPQAGLTVERYLAVETSSPGHPPVKIRAAFGVRGVAPLLHVLPGALSFTLSASQPSTANTRALLIENAGYVDLQRTGFVFEGQDASHFEVIASTCGQPSFNYASPAPATCTIPPGHAEQVRVRYRLPIGPQAPPPPPGLHRGRLRVLSDAGESGISLTGNYVP